jgi:hypothetical protein
MMWTVGIGQGVKCRLNNKEIPNRRYACDFFTSFLVNYEQQ